MGLLDKILVANKLAMPDNLKFERVGPAIASIENTGTYANSLASANDFLRTFATVQWVYAVVDKIQTNFAKLPLKFYTQSKNGEKIDITDNPKLKVFKNPHPYKYKTASKFWTYVIGYMELTGEAFIYMPRNTENQPPIQLIPLRPDRMKIIPDKDRFIKGYIYQVGSEQIPFEPWEISYSNYFNPIDDYRGLSMLEAAKNDLILELNSVSWSKSFFANGTRPDGVLKVPEKLSDANFDRLKEQFKAKYSGVDKSHQVMILEQGTEWQQISLAPKDVEFIEQRGLTKQAILAVSGVPPVLVMDLSNSSVLQNTDIQLSIFWEETMLPKVRFWQEVITTDILSLFKIEGAFPEFNLAGIKALKENAEAKERRYWAGFGNGTVTPNEIRQDVFGKEPIKDSAMDSTYLPINYIPMGMNSYSEPVKHLKAINQDDIRTAKWKIFVTRTIPLERRFARTMKGLFQELGKEVVANWNSQKSYFNGSNEIRATQKEIKEIQSQTFFDVVKWSQKFKDAGLPLIAQAIQTGGESVLRDLAAGVVFDLTDPFVVSTIRTRLESFASQVIQTTREQITNVISDGLKNNLTIEQIAGNLEAKIDVMSSSRANLIARTECVSGYNAGNMEGMNQSGLCDEHEWLTSKDDSVRDTHEPMDGIRVKIGEDFPVPPGYGGESKKYPSDYYERCTTIPVRKE